jgi:hypothetical protein
MRHTLCPKTARVMYWSRLEAALEAEELSDEFVGVLAAYRCTRCGAWHIGRVTLDKFREMLTQIKNIKAEK